MLSGTPTGHFVSTPAWNRTRTKTLGGLVLSITPPGHKSRRLDLHQHLPVYKTGASLFGHIGKYASGPKAGSVFTSTFPARRSSTPR